MKRISTVYPMLVAVVGAAAALAGSGGRASNAAPPLRVAKTDTEPPVPTRERPRPDEDADRDAVFVGDAALRGEIDLSKAVERNGHYEVDLDDGRRAVLTLDPALQQAAERVLERAKAPYGAIVVMAPDGRLLAYAGRANAEQRDRDFDLPGKVWAPAASVFKVITATALVDGGVAPDAPVCYHGGVRSVDRSHLNDDPKRDTACKDLSFALAKSQNAIIGKLAHKHLSRDRLEKVAEAFGFETAPQFALRAEPSRLELPEDSLEFARTAAGFWHSELSPLGGALLANTVGSGGLAVTPRIVASVRERDGDERPVVGVAPRRAIDEDVAERIAKMMVGTTDYGTAAAGFRDRRGRPFLPGVEVAGKTGSLTRQEPEYLAYSWFVGFAPADEPEVAIAVLLGNPPRWHLKAHTAARLVLEEVF